jgi:hypothetical protein
MATNTTTLLLHFPAHARRLIQEVLYPRPAGLHKWRLAPHFWKVVLEVVDAFWRSEAELLRVMRENGFPQEGSQYLELLRLHRLLLPDGVEVDGEFDLHVQLCHKDIGIFFFPSRNISCHPSHFVVFFSVETAAQFVCSGVVVARESESRHMKQFNCSPLTPSLIPHHMHMVCLLFCVCRILITDCDAYHAYVGRITPVCATWCTETPLSFATFREKRFHQA